MSSLDAVTGADTMRSVHTEASTHDHTGRPSASRVSATGYSRIGIAGALLLLCARRASTFLPTFPRPGFANRTSRDRGRSGTMRALTPGDLAHDRQVSPLTPLCRPDIPSPTTPCPPVVAFTVTSARPVRPSGPGFAMQSRARQDTPPNRVRSPTGCPFAAGCSPPRLATTQLPLATCAVTSHDKDLHLADKASSRTHDCPGRPGCLRPGAGAGNSPQRQDHRPLKAPA